ncbi:MAG: mycoredoxin [Actinomycetota bacterium]|nr:mycoredoxin [Actinomycetota bacterium]
MQTPVPGSVIMYSTPWCGYCRRLKSLLDREGIGYTEIDIEETPEAAEVVVQINKGDRTVPTVIFPDGTSATNPSLAQVKARLGS